jgi:hypothetical protein
VAAYSAPPPLRPAYPGELTGGKNRNNPYVRISLKKEGIPGSARKIKHWREINKAKRRADLFIPGESLISKYRGARIATGRES